MRFLKTKIYLAKQALDLKLFAQDSLKRNSEQDGLSPVQEQKPLNVNHQKLSTKDKITSHDKCADTKNISINYGRAIVAFSISPLAVQYLESYFRQESNLTISEFITSLSQVKYQIKGINSLRCMLLVDEKDSPKEVALKRGFQWISQIFIKCFSVNWIMHGKMVHKMTYLKYRSKMLRRVQKPELFTYVREVNRIRKTSVKNNMN